MTANSGNSRQQCSDLNEKALYLAKYKCSTTIISFIDHSYNWRIHVEDGVTPNLTKNETQQ